MTEINTYNPAAEIMAAVAASAQYTPAGRGAVTWFERYSYSGHSVRVWNDDATIKVVALTDVGLIVSEASFTGGLSPEVVMAFLDALTADLN